MSSNKRKVVASVAASLAMVGLSVTAAAGSAGAAGDEQVSGSAVPWVGHTPSTGAVPASSTLSVQLWLQPREAAAAAYAAGVSTPGSPTYRHYLTTAGYTARFGATPAEAAAVEGWLRSEGFRDASVDASRSYVRATASVARIDDAFKVEMRRYRASAALNAGPYALAANDRAVSLPASIASSVIGVTGLDDAAPEMTIDRAGAGSAAQSDPTDCSRYYAQQTVSGQPEKYGTTTFPTQICGYSGQQLREVYGADPTNTGSGVTVALVELGLAPDMYETLQDYARANGLPAPASDRYSELSIGAGSSCGDPFDIEEQLDVESSYAMAPGASQLVVGGDSCDDGDYGLQGLFDADLAIIDGGDGHPLASIASNSWEGGAEDQPSSLDQIEHSYLVQAATEGVGMYFSAGDGSGVLMPSSDPDAIAVGGTTLGIGAGGQRLFETGWSTGLSDISDGHWDFLGEQGASGGGSSLLWRQPAFQKGVVPPSLASGPGNRGSSRAVPDISADADPFTGFAVGVIVEPGVGVVGRTGYVETSYGGTSLASPVVAGMVAAAQQGQSAPFGFIDPLIYGLAGTSAFTDALPVTSTTPALYRGVACNPAACDGPTELLTTFDDQSPAMGTSQVTLEGYDTMTGLGSPDGQAFITALRSHAG